MKQEAVLSNHIEGNSMTLQDVLKMEAKLIQPQNSDEQAEINEISNYIRALQVVKSVVITEVRLDKKNSQE